MPSECNDVKVFGTILLGNPNDTRAALWYRCAMHHNTAQIPLTKEDGNRWLGFKSIIQSKHYSDASKRNLPLHDRADSALNPEVLNFLKDV
ncbi:MAG TPA: hypothetical protein VN704_02270, partial [Verrucomicrobiae bacterium]|nr:hypothetical protein [Verrucomicrobiae bacterium]